MPLNWALISIIISNIKCFWTLISTMYKAIKLTTTHSCSSLFLCYLVIYYMQQYALFRVSYVTTKQASYVSHIMPWNFMSLHVICHDYHSIPNASNVTVKSWDQAFVKPCFLTGYNSD